MESQYYYYYFLHYSAPVNPPPTCARLEIIISMIAWVAASAVIPSCDFLSPEVLACFFSPTSSYLAGEVDLLSPR